MSLELIPRFLIWYIVFVFSTTCHEAAHAWVARRGGDSTAYALGHVTLDPMPHIRREPWGMVLIPVLSFFMSGALIGWASVPFDPHWGNRYPRRWALMSLAGPLTNFLLAALAVVALHALTAAHVLEPLGRLGGTLIIGLPPGHDLNSPLGALATALSVMLRLNLLLGVFNLIPIPPLDGSAVVEGLGPPGVRSFYEQVRHNPTWQLLGMLLIWTTVFPLVVNPLINIVLNALGIRLAFS